MDIDNALAKLANAPLDHIDLSHIEAGVMGGIGQAVAVIQSQTPIRFGAVMAALVLGISLGGVAAARGESNETLVSGAHLAPSALLALPS